MKTQYDKIVRIICGENWNSDQVSQDERDGGYGVAICLAVLQGVPCRLNDIGDAIGCNPYYLELAYRRLQMNEVLRADSKLLNDPELLMNKARTDEDYMQAIRAWCHIAALASGFLGKKCEISRRSR